MSTKEADLEKSLTFWRAETPDWKCPEKDGWPKEGDLVILYRGAYTFPHNYTLEVWKKDMGGLSYFTPDRWLLIERKKNERNE